MTSPLARLTGAIKHPVSTAAYTAGLVRGFGTEMVRVAAGQRGGLMPGCLSGAVAAPIEENVAPEEITRLRLVEPLAEPEHPVAEQG